MQKKIALKDIIITLLAFALGAVLVIIINNTLSSEILQFDTLELIGFVFSIVIGGSSIVLAITAINLGKSSEELMISRSERSIELQNEVYIRTTEALKRIESSTDVTEKRIEDIISGRVGDIATRLIDDKIVPAKNKKILESQLRKSITEELTEEEKEERREKAIKRERLRVEKKEFENDLLVSLSNLEGTRSLRLSSGTMLGTDEELLDGLFEKNGKKYGVSIFYKDYGFMDNSLDNFINNLAEAISKNAFNRVFLIFDAKSSITDEFEKSLDEIKRLYKDEISQNIQLVIGNKEEIINAISTYADS